MFTAMFAIVMSASGVGSTQQQSPDFKKASIAKDYIFYLIDRVSKIDALVHTTADSDVDRRTAT